MSLERSRSKQVGPEPEYEDGSAPETDDLVGSDSGVLLPAGSAEKPAISLVMPTLNEEEGIAECIRRAKNAFRELGVNAEIIVSDSSTDRTPEIAQEMGAIVVEPDGKGYGYAYQYAFDRARADVIAMGDADTTYDFEELPKLYDLVVNGEADMAMGSRLEGEIRPGSMPKLHQYIGNPLLTKFLNAFYGAGVSDAHSGMRAFTREALETMDCETVGMEFASEMIMKAGAEGLTIEEVPIVYHEREGEEKLESFKDGWRHVRFMLENAPGYLFSVPGAAMCVLGLVAMIFAGTNLSIGGISLGPHSMIAGSLLTVIGFQIMCLGAFTRVAGDPIRSPQDWFTTALTEHMDLAKGATGGLVLAGAGGLYGALMIGRWVESGFQQLPLLLYDVFAFTALVIGVQMVFVSFFLSALSQSRQTA